MIAKIMLKSVVCDHVIIGEGKITVMHIQMKIEAQKTQQSLVNQLQNIDVVAQIRSLPMSLQRYLQVVPPIWMVHARDSLYSQIQAMPTLYHRGRVVWAAIVQANQLMFQQGQDSCPGEVLYDPSGQTSPSQLRELAHQLFALKHTQPTQLDQLEYAQHITNERTRIKNFLYPQSLAAVPLRLTSTWFWRGHLPDGILTMGFFPILISDECPGDVMVLPSLFWPEEFKSSWLHQSCSSKPYLEQIILDQLKSGQYQWKEPQLEPPLAQIIKPILKNTYLEPSKPQQTATTRHQARAPLGLATVVWIVVMISVVVLLLV